MSYQPKTGAACSCKRGVQRDNCPTCEGTGMVIDFAAVRERAKSPHVAFEVLRRGRVVDTVFYSRSANVDADEVRRSLIGHDGYPSDIEVRKRT